VVASSGAARDDDLRGLKPATPFSPSAALDGPLFRDSTYMFFNHGRRAGTFGLPSRSGRAGSPWQCSGSEGDSR